MIYVAGPMSGLPEFNFPAFEAETQRLRALGYEVLSPHEGVEDTTKPWGFYMRKAISLLIQCDSIILLPGWENSKGARLEESIAHNFRMTLFYLTGPRSYVKCTSTTPT